MELVELLQRSDPDKFTVLADAEERHVLREEPCEVECMHILGRAVLLREGQVLVEEHTHIGRPGIVGPDDELAHRRILTDSGGETAARSRTPTAVVRAGAYVTSLPTWWPYRPIACPPCWRASCGPASTSIGGSTETLGLAPTDHRPSHLVQALDFALGTNNGLVRRVVFRPRSHATGLRLMATGIDWSRGAGPEVAGSALDVLSALCGQPRPANRLTGDGAALLVERTSPSADR